MKKTDSRLKNKRVEVMSNLKKGELKECPNCRFGCGKDQCSLSFPNELEVVEEVRGKCWYFSGKKEKK